MKTNIQFGLVALLHLVVCLPLSAQTHQLYSLPPANSADYSQPAYSRMASLPQAFPSFDGVAPVGLHAVSAARPMQLEPDGLRLASLGPHQVEDAASCGKGCQKACCCGPAWEHRTGVSGEFLFLRPRDAEVAFVLPVTGAVPTGDVGVADPDYDVGVRVGFSLAMDTCTSLVGSYARYESGTFNQVDVNPSPALNALLLHPDSTNAASVFLTSTADFDVDFELADLAYRSVWVSSELSALNYFVGVRYGRLDQDLRAVYENGGTTETVTSDVEFDGIGLRLGVDGERHNCRGFLVYGNAAVSFLAGELRSDYVHVSSQDPIVVQTGWKAGRVVTMLDLEVGAGWQSRCGRLRLTAGYVFTGWLNALSTDEWVESVKANNFVGMDDGMSFDGLTGRAEFRF